MRAVGWYWLMPVLLLTGCTGAFRAVSLPEVRVEPCPLLAPAPLEVHKEKQVAWPELLRRYRVARAKVAEWEAARAACEGGG